MGDGSAGVVSARRSGRRHPGAGRDPAFSGTCRRSGPACAKGGDGAAGCQEGDRGRRSTGRKRETRPGPGFLEWRRARPVSAAASRRPCRQRRRVPPAVRACGRARRSPPDRRRRSTPARLRGWACDRLIDRPSDAFVKVRAGDGVEQLAQEGIGPRQHVGRRLPRERLPGGGTTCGEQAVAQGLRVHVGELVGRQRFDQVAPLVSFDRCKNAS